MAKAEKIEAQAKTISLLRHIRAYFTAATLIIAVPTGIKIFS
jgi:heme/copper-type cytochrome/quinol oxidase subunit 1